MSWLPHLARPGWLLLVPLIVLLWWLLRRRVMRSQLRGQLVAPHLVAALTSHHDPGRGLLPADAVAVVALLLACAAAGPGWTRQQSPWFEETAPLIIALEVSDSMRSNDLLPTRLDRARFKVLDLLAQRGGGRTALIAYAGSAHIVLPPSNDLAVLKPFLESLDPAIMPASGSSAATVLPLVRKLLGDDAQGATVLFVNDGFDSSDVPALAGYAARPDAATLAALVVGSDDGGVALLPDGSPVMAPGGGRLDTRIDTGTLRRVASQAGVGVIRAGTGDRDVRALLGVVMSSLRQAADADARWRDDGWWLLWPALLLALPWFRRGWIMP